LAKLGAAMPLAGRYSTTGGGFFWSELT